MSPGQTATLYCSHLLPCPVNMPSKDSSHGEETVGSVPEIWPWCVAVAHRIALSPPKNKTSTYDAIS